MAVRNCLECQQAQFKSGADGSAHGHASALGTSKSAAAQASDPGSSPRIIAPFVERRLHVLRRPAAPSFVPLANTGPLLSNLLTSDYVTTPAAICDTRRGLCHCPLDLIQWLPVKSGSSSLNRVSKLIHNAAILYKGHYVKDTTPEGASSLSPENLQSVP